MITHKGVPVSVDMVVDGHATVRVLGTQQIRVVAIHALRGTRGGVMEVARACREGERRAKRVEEDTATS